MTQVTPEQAMQIALQHHQAGRLAEAEGIYRQLLAQQPNHVDALHLLGVLANQVGNSAASADLIRRAIELAPEFAPAYSNLANALSNLGQHQDAMLACHRALNLKPDSAEAYLNLGNALRSMGRIDEAADAYRSAAKLRPGHPDAFINLSVALKAQGKFAEAVAACRTALTTDPNSVAAYINLGDALLSQGNHAEAILACRRAVEINPLYAEAQANLANALREQGKLEEAIVAYREAIRLKPTYTDAWNNLGAARMKQGKLDEAIEAYRRAIELEPGLAEAHSNLGNTLCELGRFEEAVTAQRRAVELKPGLAEVHYNLGNALRGQGDFDQATLAYRKALELNPRYAKAHNNLGTVFSRQFKLDQAVAAYQTSLETDPDFAAAYNNLGTALKDSARLDDALVAYDRAMNLTPENPAFHSNRVFVLYFHPAFDAAMIHEETRRWNERHARPFSKLIGPHRNSPDPQRRLKIGYVSPDFTSHPVGRFILPAIEHRDPAAVEVYCYSDVSLPDKLTTQLQNASNGWRSIFGLSDQRVAELVRQDGIDILVDLTMHTADNRLPMFARKPAPVQVTWLAYPGGTGLDAMDYRITDAHLDPDPANDRLYTEQSVRLGDCWWCYRPLPEAPAVGPLPASEAGHVTFGSLNNFAKVNHQTLTCWAKLMREMPGSRFMLLTPEGSARERVTETFERENVSVDRICFLSRMKLDDYFKVHNQMDVALDPFPCSGGTTSCDALWMGIPVVTLVGQTAAGRGTSTVLQTIGLKELAAESEEQYVQIARELGSDLPRLSEIRSSLRERMRISPLMDEPGFARKLESAYREMWKKWCR